MSLLNKKTMKAKYPLTPAEPTHRHWTVFDEIMDLWICNRNGILLVLIAVMIITLLLMIGYAAGAGHFRMFSTPQNTYEHLNQVVLYYA